MHTNHDNVCNNVGLDPRRNGHVWNVIQYVYLVLIAHTTHSIDVHTENVAVSQRSLQYKTNLTSLIALNGQQHSQPPKHAACRTTLTGSDCAF